MTVAIPEAVSAVEGAGGGAAAARGGGKVVQGRVEGSTYDLRNARTRPSGGGAAAPASTPGRGGPTVQPVVGLGGRGGGSTGGGRSYQGAILAEFLVAVLVVAFLPLASGPGDGKTGPSPYRVNDMIQLVAIGAVYFILALFSNGERSGRVVAWFGGLLVVGILIAKVGSGQLSAAVSGVSGVSKADLDNT
jgi:hypothetical protein